jgi:hypothetical protein
VAELSEIERDAALMAEVLAGLSAYLRCKGDGKGTAAVHLADEGTAAARRVLAYLRELRGNGDGVAAQYPPRLGPWREWCPPRGHVLDSPARRVDTRRRCDPGE